ncbi:MAG: DUF4292 domain-containing protein [Bacteroidetes bacterium]|nr:MAG: DUF4292 domain-containing protein [Bacteroidota bacterium]
MTMTIIKPAMSVRTLKFSPLPHPLHKIAALCLFLTLLSAAQGSCRRKVPGEQVIPATAPRSSAFLTEQLMQPRFQQVKTMRAAARVYAEQDGMAVEAGANLIWIRDSVLWLNVKKLGIEAVRALITKDSVFILNRLDKTYSAASIHSLQREYSLPEGFPLLQQVLLASAWIDPEMLLESSVKDSLHRLAGTNRSLTADYRIEEGTFVLRQETFLQQRDSRMLSLGFGGFKKIPGFGTFPYIRRVEAYSPETGVVRLDLEFSNIELNVPDSYRFDIPAHYQPVK